MGEKTEEFLVGVKRSAAERGGYVLSKPQTELYDSNNDSESRDWRLRIAIDPDPQNIQKAARVLADLFHKKNRDLELKIFVFPLVNPATSWVGTQKSIVDDTDRDQRGKEVCVYMRYDECRHKYEISSEIVKPYIKDMN